MMRIKGSYVWAFLITAGIGLWMASGTIVVGGRPDAAQADVEDVHKEDEPLFRVRAFHSVAQKRLDRLVVRGLTAADQRVRVNAETAGLVSAIDVRKGEWVRQGETLCHIDVGAREALVSEAEATVARTEHELEAAKRLADREFMSETELRQRRAAFQAALYSLEQAKLDLRRTKITAPFDGVIEDLPVEIGSFLNVGALCATVVSMDPMLVAAPVSEREIGALEIGMEGEARLVTGETVAGKLSFISPVADGVTRTFRIEMEIPNQDRRIRDGLTSEIAFALPSTDGHRAPSSVLVLNDAGVLGVRGVDDTGRVTFYAVKILETDDDGVWLGGLPEMLSIISLGQDYVIDGQFVDPVFKTAGSSS